MRAGFRARTAPYTFLALTASFVLVWTSGCCKTDEWRTHTFVDAGLSFELPDSWTVRVVRPGSDPQDLDDAVATDVGVDGAVVTALPLLEDAALVIVAPQNRVSTEVFARQAQQFIPLDNIVVSNDPARWGNGTFSGWATGGKGALRGSGTKVEWRWVALEIDGQPVIVCLYAEEDQVERYDAMFNRILQRIAPMGAPAPAPQ
jgi:hypothetical protein